MVFKSGSPILIYTGNNILISSDNGNTFQTMTTNLSNKSCYPISYDHDNNRFLMMNNNLPYCSYDGSTWTQCGSSPVMFAGGSSSIINYDGGVYVTPVDRVAPYYSYDMNTWYKTGFSTTDVSDDSYCRDIIYDSVSGKIAETFYYNSTGTYGIAIGNLTGGIISNTTGDKYSNVIVANGYFIFSFGTTLYFRLATDPRNTWNLKYTQTHLEKICYHDGILLGVDSNSFYKSTDLGSTWTTITALSYGTPIDLCYGKGYYWYLCSHYDPYTQSYNYCLYKSTDATNWIQVTTINNACTFCIGEKNNGRY